MPIVWWDEFAFLKHNGVVYKSAAPAQSKIAEIAKQHGKPFSKIITTTPKCNGPTPRNQRSKIL